MTGPEGVKGEKRSYLIAASTDRGENWSFLDGAGFQGDRNHLLRVIPDFPERLALPAIQPGTWKKQ